MIWYDMIWCDVMWCDVIFFYIYSLLPAPLLQYINNITSTLPVRHRVITLIIAINFPPRLTPQMILNW
jgi:hypothetical protein